jgi:hypothetical protein
MSPPDLPVDTVLLDEGTGLYWIYVETEQEGNKVGTDLLQT